MLHDHINAVVDQGVRRIGFFRWVKPSVDPNYRHLDIRVHLLCVQEGGVDALDHFRDREGCDVTDLVGLGHVASDCTDHGAAFIKACVISRHIRMVTPIAGRMLELHVWETRGNGIGCIHVPKRRGEDNVRAGQRHLCHHTFTVGTFRHVFLENGFYLVAISGFHGQTALIVLVSPATVTNRTHIDKTYGGGVLRSGPGRQTGSKRGAGQKALKFHSCLPIVC